MLVALVYAWFLLETGGPPELGCGRCFLCIYIFNPLDLDKDSSKRVKL